MTAGRRRRATGPAGPPGRPDRPDQTFADVRLHDDGTISWQPRPDDVFVITGTYSNGARFRPFRTRHWSYAQGVNLYRGTIWLERDGRRKRIRQVWN